MAKSTGGLGGQNLLPGRLGTSSWVSEDTVLLPEEMAPGARGPAVPLFRHRAVCEETGGIAGVPVDSDGFVGFTDCTNVAGVGQLGIQSVLWQEPCWQC